jgi:gamma-glutamylcysteine synthetase
VRRSSHFHNEGGECFSAMAKSMLPKTRYVYMPTYLEKWVKGNKKSKFFTIIQGIKLIIPQKI